MVQKLHHLVLLYHKMTRYYRPINQAGLDLIKTFEGFSDTVYLDAVGIPTIGYGHVVKDGEKFGRISKSEGELLLRSDLREASRGVINLVAVPLSDNQYAALVSFVFNLGSGRLKASTLRAKLNRGDYQGAADEFPKWCYAGGKKLRGLLRRREAERKLWMTTV